MRDVCGQEIKQGDLIAIAMRHGSTPAKLVVRSVTKVTEHVVVFAKAGGGTQGLSDYDAARRVMVVTKEAHCVL